MNVMNVILTRIGPRTTTIRTRPAKCTGSTRRKFAGTSRRASASWAPVATLPTATMTEQDPHRRGGRTTRTGAVSAAAAVTATAALSERLRWGSPRMRDAGPSRVASSCTSTSLTCRRSRSSHLQTRTARFSWTPCQRTSSSTHAWLPLVTMRTSSRSRRGRRGSLAGAGTCASRPTGLLCCAWRQSLALGRSLSVCSPHRRLAIRSVPVSAARIRTTSSLVLLASAGAIFRSWRRSAGCHVSTSAGRTMCGLTVARSHSECTSWRRPRRKIA
mmetsp:Transcript_80616/g.207518  ORF Transcript_80616/g.207518 Transcript_80616/m.207518 type:complete len:273 (+) Transcript_80616:222-1040(+)